jgi:di/tricarboxylate transporter
VDVDVIVVIAASFGLGEAMARSGVAGILAGGLVDTLGVFGSTGTLLGLVLGTIALTSVITNNAGVVLMFPITVAAATRLDLDVRPFAMAVAVAASASFLTPIGYQTNLMVYGPGGYRFSDYIRLGGVVTLVVVPTILLAVLLS